MSANYCVRKCVGNGRSRRSDFYATGRPPTEVDRDHHRPSARKHADNETRDKNNTFRDILLLIHPSSGAYFADGFCMDPPTKRPVKYLATALRIEAPEAVKSTLKPLPLLLR